MKSIVLLLCVACSLAAPKYPSSSLHENDRDDHDHGDGHNHNDGHDHHPEANYNTLRDQAIAPTMTAKLVDNHELAAETDSNLDVSQPANFQENLRSPTNKKIASPCRSIFCNGK